MEERTRISFYKSYSSTFFKLQKKNDQNLYASILFELFFMDIEKIEDFVDDAEIYTNCIYRIQKVEKFIHNNLNKKQKKFLKNMELQIV